MRLVTIICLCTLGVACVLGKSVLEENKQKDLPEDVAVKPLINDHNIFFNRLSDAEKAWLMHIAILYDTDYRKPGEKPIIEQPEIPEIEKPEIPEIEEPSPINLFGKSIKNGEGQLVPYPIPDETPTALMTGLLNGNIPSGWQKRFTRWLRTDFNLTKDNFEYYRTTGAFCPPNRQCPGFGDIGAECCPFG